MALTTWFFRFWDVSFRLQPRRDSPCTNGTAIREQGDRHAKAFAGRHRGCGGDGGGVGRGGRLEPSGLQGAAADSGVQLDRLVRRRACRWRLGDEGVAGSDRNLFDVAYTTFNFPDTTINNYGINGFLGGVQIGYNYQSGPWVWGVEAQASWAGIRGSRRLSLLYREETTCKTNVDALGSFAVRFGGTIDRAMLYVKGGLAWAYETHKISSPTSFFRWFGAFQHRTQALAMGRDARCRRRVRLHQQHLREARVQLHGLRHANIFVRYCPGVFPFVTPEDVDVKIRQSIHLVKVGLNYRFDVGKYPVSARY